MNSSRLSSYWARPKKIIEYILVLIQRYPWAIAIFGFVSGILSFFTVERDQEKFAQILSVLMLVSWVWLALENLLRRGIASLFGFQLPPPLLSFVTQMVQQESLFFVVPFFFISTAWNTGQSVFTSLLIVFAVVSIIDPIYYSGLAARRWLYFIFHGVTLFAVLMTALPIIFHLPTPKSYALSLAVAVVLSLPGVIRAIPLNWFRRTVVAIVLIVMVVGIGWFTRAWIPPSTLRLTHVAITDSIDDQNKVPTNELTLVTVEQLQNGIYAYTAIRAPRGLNERIYHVWRLNGQEVDRIALDINGGRDQGYRAWTHKLNFPQNPVGRWQIRVITEADQVIGVLRFDVVNTAATEPQPSEPEPLDPEPSEPEPSEPESSEPVPSEQVPSEPEPIEPEPAPQ